MMDWIADLADLAGKTEDAEMVGESWQAAEARKVFAAEASPERVRVLCELAEAARWYRTRRHGDPADPQHQPCALCDAVDALARLEPARKEET